MHKIRTGDYLQFTFNKFNNMEIDFNNYDCFIAECYEAEDEFWKGIYEDIEADYWINEEKENF
jgi:hypothetical protein